MSIESLLLTLVAAFLTHAFALYASRKGTSRSHVLAFWAGLIGSFSVAVALVALIALLPQFLFASSSSPAGVAFQVGLGAAVACALASLWLAISILRPSRSAKAV